MKGRQMFSCLLYCNCLLPLRDLLQLRNFVLNRRVAQFGMVDDFMKSENLLIAGRDPKEEEGYS